jgi:hypothetical protein
MTYMKEYSRKRGKEKNPAIKNGQHIHKIRQQEKQVSDRLAERESGLREVQTSFGYIDVLTKTEVIEVKAASNWKGALGQVLVYNIEYPGLRPRLHIYGKVTNSYYVMMNQACKAHGIRLTLEQDYDRQDFTPIKRNRPGRKSGIPTGDLRINFIDTDGELYSLPY